MFHYITGNLLESSASALVNTVNTVGVMGKGIALQFREAFPDNYKKYKKICKEGALRIGDLFITEETTLFGESKTIINFPTKTHWRYPSEYSYIEAGLKTLRNEILRRKIPSVAIPPLGSHNGGLHWPMVKQLIEKNLSGLDCEIYIYQPSPKIAERMKSERISLTPARAILLVLLSDLMAHGEFASVFAAEKLIYFLQKFGAKKYFNIEFSPYLYGPYSRGKVAHVLYALNGSYLKGMTAMDIKPFDFIWLTDDAEEIAKNYLDTYANRDIWAIINKTKDFLKKYYSNLSLEILSTTDYLLENSESLKGWQTKDQNYVTATLSNEIKKMSQRKHNIFLPEYISLAVGHLKTVNIDVPTN